MAKHPISTKQTSGTTKLSAIDVVSAMYPISTGATAPPTIDMIKYEEARLVCSSSPRIARAKMVGNMMDSHRKQRKKPDSPILPDMQITASMARVAPPAQRASSFSGRRYPISQLPSHASQHEESHAAER